MKLYIKVENGQPVDHPMAEENVLCAFPEVSLQNLPDWLMPFERVPLPVVGVYETYTHTTYEIENGVCKDVHHVSTFDEQAKRAKQALVKKDWAQNGAYLYPSWVWDEAGCSYKPPLPRPDDGGKYIWDEATLNWVPVVDPE